MAAMRRIAEALEPYTLRYCTAKSGTALLGTVVMAMGRAAWRYRRKKAVR